MIQLIIIAVYFVAMAVIGITSRKSASNAEGFFVAGRSVSTPRLTGALVATIVGGSATIGVAGLGFSRGINGAWWLLVGTIGLVVLGTFLAGKVRKTGVYSLPGLAEKQYGKSVAMASSVLIIIAWLGIIAGQIIATGKIMSVFGMGDPMMWMIIFTAIAIFYTVLGGQHADIKTDLVQAAIIFVGIFVAAAVLLPQLGGFSGLKSALPGDYFSFPLSSKFGSMDLLSYLLLIGLPYVVGADIYSKILSAKDEKTAQKSALWSALLIIPIGFAGAIIGMGAKVLFPNIISEQAFPMVAVSALPAVAGGLLLAGLLSATMSSVDSCLLSASTILTVDIVKKFKPQLSERSVMLIARWAIVIVGFLSLLMALALKGVISSLMFAYTIFASGVIIPVLFGFYKDKLKVTSMGAMAAIIGGGGLALISKLPTLINVSNIPLIGNLTAVKHLDLWSLAVSVLLLFTVSFVENTIIKDKKIVTR
jgi:SSS family solute:Na+ symporter